MNPKDFLPSSAGRVIRVRSGYYAFLPAPLPPQINWQPALVSLAGEAERVLARLAEVGMNFPAPHAMVLPFIRQEAVLSSRIEGTQTSLEQLYTYEAAQLSFLPDTREVQNYVSALDEGLKRLDSLPVSSRLIRELHARLMRGVRGEHSTPGEFRRSQNWIGPPGSTLENAPYVPPPVDEMQNALSELEKYIHRPSDLPLLAQLALVHYQFEAIHPFLDGNGRVGRLLIALLMCEWKLLPLPLLYLSSYFESNRSEYYARLLTVSQRGEWENWLRFFFIGVRDQAQQVAARISLLRNLLNEYQVTLKKERDAERLLQVVNFLIGHPLVSIRQVQKEISANDYNSAERIVNKLVKLDILKEITGRSRNRLFRAVKIWKAIEGRI